jgi:hypothetical protein
VSLFSGHSRLSEHTIDLSDTVQCQKQETPYFRSDEMKKGYLLGLIVYLTAWLSLPGADFFDIPHVAADTWETTITMYNLGDGTETITLKHWDQDGQMTGSVQYDVPAHGNTELLSSGFGYNGIARVECFEDVTIKVKLSYLFLKENTESLYEFFCKQKHASQQMVPPKPLSIPFRLVRCRLCQSQ